ncbi:hypothetical protein WA158_005523 [Blastocystis sp. Blastoise]
MNIIFPNNVTTKGLLRKDRYHRESSKLETYYDVEEEIRSRLAVNHIFAKRPTPKPTEKVVEEPVDFDPKKADESEIDSLPFITKHIMRNEKRNNVNGVIESDISSSLVSKTGNNNVVDDDDVNNQSISNHPMDTPNELPSDAIDGSEDSQGNDSMTLSAGASETQESVPAVTQQSIKPKKKKTGDKLLDAFFEDQDEEVEKIQPSVVSSTTVSKIDQTVYNKPINTQKIEETRNIPSNKNSNDDDDDDDNDDKPQELTPVTTAVNKGNNGNNNVYNSGNNNVYNSGNNIVNSGNNIVNSGNNNVYNSGNNIVNSGNNVYNTNTISNGNEVHNGNNVVNNGNNVVNNGNEVHNGNNGNTISNGNEVHNGNNVYNTNTISNGDLDNEGVPNDYSSSSSMRRPENSMKYSDDSLLLTRKNKNRVVYRTEERDSMNTNGEGEGEEQEEEEAVHFVHVPRRRSSKHSSLRLKYGNAGTLFSNQRRSGLLDGTGSSYSSLGSSTRNNNYNDNNRRDNLNIQEGEEGNENDPFTAKRTTKVATLMEDTDSNAILNNNPPRIYTPDTTSTSDTNTINNNSIPSYTSNIAPSATSNAGILAQLDLSPVLFSSSSLYEQHGLQSPFPTDPFYSLSIQEGISETQPYIKKYISTMNSENKDIISSVYYIPPQARVALERLIKINTRLIKSPYKSRSICYMPVEGDLATVLQGYASAMLLALLTNKGFAVCDFPSFKIYFSTPFEIPVIQLASSLDEETTTKVITDPQCQDLKLFRGGSFDGSFNKYMSIFQTGCNLIPILLKNPSYKARFASLGYIYETDAEIAQVAFGIQHFLYSKTIFPSKTIFDKIKFSLDRWNQGVYIGTYLSQQDTQDINTYIYNMKNKIQALSNTLPQPNYWFVASTDVSIKTNFANSKSNKVMLYDADILPISSILTKKRSKAVFDNIIELTILSKCDYLLVPSSSLYGYIAQAISGRYTSS